MKNKLIFVTMFLFSLGSRAEFVTSIGANNVFEREAYATQYSSRTPLAIRFGYQEFSNSIFAEYNQFYANDSIPQVSISRTQHEVLAWVRHSFWSENPLQMYLQSAPGVQLVHVQTHILKNEQEDTSQPYLALAIAVGVATQIEHFRFELEFRAISSQVAAPNPTLSVGLFGGYVF